MGVMELEVNYWIASTHTDLSKVPLSHCRLFIGDLRILTVCIFFLAVAVDLHGSHAEKASFQRESETREDLGAELEIVSSVNLQSVRASAPVIIPSS
jgi:hypothetical protein